MKRRKNKRYKKINLKFIFRIANGVETASVGFGSLGQENEAATR